MERFNHIESYRKRKNTNTSYHPESVMQRFFLMNAFCESMIAAVFLSARMQQKDPNYHYRTPSSVGDMQIFMDTLLKKFLRGWQAIRQKEGRVSHAIVPRLLLELDEEEYDLWLHKTAQQIIYWTAEQPESVSEENRKDCYFCHYALDKKFPTDLYLDQVIQGKSDSTHHYFYSTKGVLALGGRNDHFLLTAFLMGLTKFSASFLKAQIIDQ